jgi:hypothetical protein
MNWHIKKRTTILILGVGVAVVAAAFTGRALWVRKFHHYPPRELVRDIRAGLAAKDIPEPKARVEAFLTARYGPLTDPANRQRAFLDFFNVDHTRALDMITGRTSTSQKQADTQAMAEWIAHYRKTMSKEERTALRTRINSESGRTMLQQSTAHYLAQDEATRAAQKPVMSELTSTLTSLWMP